MSRSAQPAQLVEGHLPNLVVIGAMKCGTTSLYEYLSSHPAITMSKVKEIEFFSRHFNRGEDWYRAHFPRPARIRGEASTGYTKYPNYTGVPQRMHALVPDAKLIYLVRDPIERSVSHYLHERTRGREARPAAQALTDPNDNQYLAYSRYHMQLEQFLRFYSPESVLILVTRDLRHSRRATLDQIAEFLAIEGAFREDALRQLHNQSAGRRVKTRLGAWLLGTGIADKLYRLLPASVWEHGKALTQARIPTPRPSLDDTVRDSLASTLRPDVEALRSLTGKRFAHWQL